jgi:hypothetical protein
LEEDRDLKDVVEGTYLEKILEKHHTRKLYLIRRSAKALVRSKGVRTVRSEMPRPVAVQ